jgi:hypothetical protein
VNIAVADLDRASADYAHLGFALKDGRPHPDGIRNRHVKFRDGTEIELITAPAATDTLTTHYRQLIEKGDGPAFLALDVEPRPLADFPFETPLGYVFFAGMNQSPTDRPEHFAHANGATSLAGVTMSAENLEPERALFRGFGLEMSRCEPGRTECVVLRDGRVVRLHQAAGARRRIVEIELRVADLLEASRLLDERHVGFRAERSRLTVEGEITHGVTLTFATGAADDTR